MLTIVNTYQQLFKTCIFQVLLKRLKVVDVLYFFYIGNKFPFGVCSAVVACGKEFFRCVEVVDLDECDRDLLNLDEDKDLDADRLNWDRDLCDLEWDRLVRD